MSVVRGLLTIKEVDGFELSMLGNLNFDSDNPRDPCQRLYSRQNNREAIWVVGQYHMRHLIPGHRG